MSDIQLSSVRRPGNALRPSRRKPGGKPRGPKPGTKHAGTFKPGFDPRRAKYTERDITLLPTYNGKTMAQIARDMTPDVARVLHEATTREDVPWPVRVSASQYLADRGWGRAAQTLDVNMNGGNALSLADTLRLMATVSPELLERLDQGTVLEGQLATDQLHATTPALENKG